MAPSTSANLAVANNTISDTNNNSDTAASRSDGQPEHSGTDRLSCADSMDRHDEINNNGRLNHMKNYNEQMSHERIGMNGDFENSTIVEDELGPLPQHWEKAYSEQGEPYFINLATNTSQWDDPRLCGGLSSVIGGSSFGLSDVAGSADQLTGLGSEQIGSSLEQLEQLPYGWERIDDPQYGTYYIDHINKRTQYESPLHVPPESINNNSNNKILSGNGVLNTSDSTLSIPLSSAYEDSNLEQRPVDNHSLQSRKVEVEQGNHSLLHDSITRNSNTKGCSAFAEQRTEGAQYARVVKGNRPEATQWMHTDSSSEAASAVDPLYASIYSKKRDGEHINSGLASAHNYANVYEPQYRMSEGHRHRENGMVSLGGDDLEKINESQATENDSVFTSGGNHDMDLSIQSDTDSVREQGECKALDEPQKNSEKLDERSHKSNNRFQSHGASTAESKKLPSAAQINQMNNAKEGILSLMPCLASCVQDKTYASIGEFKKSVQNNLQVPDINVYDANAKRTSVDASSLKNAQGLLNSSHNQSYASIEKGDCERTYSRGLPVNSVLPNSNTAPIHINQQKDSDNGRKVPPPTLPKPMMSHVSQPLLPPQYQLPYVFTKNPAALVGEIIHVSLIKSQKGFGFTIIGGNDHQAEEFLQIKSITPGGPAWNDKQLQTGDVLVHVNSICVLGYTHSDVVSLFQSIAPGETVHLQICRGYKLPFDPDDPNMEIVTTQAVTANNHSGPAETDNESMINRSVVGVSQDYQDIYGTVMRKMQNIDLSRGSLGGSAVPGNQPMALSSSNVEQHNSFHEETVLDFEPPKFFTVEIVKGNTGFGFTIADSANGQKVKKILDEARCQNLAEGDILVDINGRDIRTRLHSEVVQALKECNIGSTARITVQRGGFTTAKAGAPESKNLEDAGSERESHASTSFSQFNFNPNPKSFQYRSKTPTAELYSSAKEVVIQRPKTPVVDTRNWDCPEKPPRTGPSALPEVPGSTVVDSNMNNSLYGVTGHHQAHPGHQMHPQTRFEDDVYGHVRPRSEVWNYDYPTPAGGQRTMARNAHSAAANSDYANYYAIYGNDQMTLPPENSIYGTTGYAESVIPSARDYNVDQSNAYPQMAEFRVTLHRQESGFGFRIVGGTEEGSQVTIGHIVTGGAADLDGQIITGDEILSVDGHSVTSASHHHVVQLMGAAALHGEVTLGLRRRSSGNLHNTSGQSADVVPGYTYNVIVERHESEGFGFVIISSVGKCGSTIGRIIAGSPAERCGKLQIGDRIHAVNGISILDMHHEDIVNLIKVSGLSVSLTIAPRSSSVNVIQDDLSSIGTNRPLGPDDFNDRPGSRMLAASSIVEGQLMPPASPGGGPPEFRRVVLQRGVRGFGFSIRGGREFHNMPLFVLRIAEMGPAQMSGQLHVGDQILEVNGICTDNMTHAEAIGLIRQGGNAVTLLIKRTSAIQQPLTVESPPTLLSHHSSLLGGPISQSSPRSPSSMLLHSPHQTQMQQHSLYGVHGGQPGQWIG